MNSRIERLSHQLTKKPGLYRTAELRKQRISSRDVEQLIEAGVIQRLQRGLYRVGPDNTFSPFASFAEAFKMIPEGIICLHSALAYHDLTTFVPADVYVAVPQGAWHPQFDYPPVRYFTFSSTTYTLGRITINIDGEEIAIYDQEKTICDCLRFRKRLGLDVALEGLKAYLRKPGHDIQKLIDYAVLCRIHSVMNAYLEGLLA